MNLKIDSYHSNEHQDFQFFQDYKNIELLHYYCYIVLQRHKSFDYKDQLKKYFGSDSIKFKKQLML